MTPRRPYADLELEQDLELQWRSWRTQRVGWLLLAAVLVAALLGVFGSGPCSNASAVAGGLRVHYERFLRLQQAAVLAVEADAPTGGELVLRFDGDYLRQQQLESVLPAPLRAEADADGGIRFVFASARPRARVQFHLRPDAAGLLHGGVAAGDGAGVQFTQLVYP